MKRVIMTYLGKVENVPLDQNWTLKQCNIKDGDSLYHFRD